MRQKQGRSSLANVFFVCFFLACIGSQYASPGSLGGSKCIDPHHVNALPPRGQAIKRTPRAFIRTSMPLSTATCESFLNAHVLQGLCRIERTSLIERPTLT